MITAIFMILGEPQAHDYWFENAFFIFREYEVAVNGKLVDFSEILRKNKTIKKF